MVKNHHFWHELSTNRVKKGAIKMGGLFTQAKTSFPSRVGGGGGKVKIF